MNNSSTEKKEEYNAVPVLYCKNCLSLRIRSVPMEISDFCDDCGSTNIVETSIEEWEELYKKRFGHRYLEEY